jgi:hypothetical protein
MGLPADHSKISPFPRVAKLLLNPTTWVAWLDQYPDSAELVAAAHRLITVLAKETGLSEDVTLDRLGCRVREPEDVRALTPDGLQKCIDFMHFVHEVIRRLDLDQDKRLALGRAVGLYQDAGADLEACSRAMNAVADDDLSAMDLVSLGEIARAFEVAREHLLPDAEMQATRRAKPHLSPHRLSLLANQRSELLGRQVASRMEQHVEMCHLCGSLLAAARESADASAAA